VRHIVLVLLLTGALLARANTPISPTTTLAKETGNNTSTANSFLTQTNGNLGANNVSKVPLRSLLYNGSHTKLYAHLMPWFGNSSHINVGYNSATLTQTNAQVAEVQQRDPKPLNVYEPSVFMARLPDGRLQLVSQ